MEKYYVEKLRLKALLRIIMKPFDELGLNKFNPIKVMSSAIPILKLYGFNYDLFDIEYNDSVSSITVFHMHSRENYTSNDYWYNIKFNGEPLGEEDDKYFVIADNMPDLFKMANDMLFNTDWAELYSKTPNLLANSSYMNFKKWATRFDLFNTLLSVVNLTGTDLTDKELVIKCDAYNITFPMEAYKMKWMDISYSMNFITCSPTMTFTRMSDKCTKCKIEFPINKIYGYPDITDLNFGLICIDFDEHHNVISYTSNNDIDVNDSNFGLPMRRDDSVTNSQVFSLNSITDYVFMMCINEAWKNRWTYEFRDYPDTVDVCDFAEFVLRYAYNPNNPVIGDVITTNVKLNKYPKKDTYYTIKSCHSELYVNDESCKFGGFYHIQVIKNHPHHNEYIQNQITSHIASFGINIYPLSEYTETWIDESKLYINDDSGYHISDFGPFTPEFLRDITKNDILYELISGFKKGKLEVVND